MTGLILALDFGGTKHTAAVVAPGEREWRSLLRTLSPPNANASTDLAIMRSHVQELLNGEKPAAIGVSFGGPVDATTGTVRLCDHVRGWEHRLRRQRFEVLREYAYWHRQDDDAWAVYLERIPSRKPAPDISTPEGQQEFLRIIREKERLALKSEAEGIENMPLTQLRSYALKNRGNVGAWRLYFEKLGISNTEPVPLNKTMLDIAEIVQRRFKGEE